MPPAAEPRFDLAHQHDENAPALGRGHHFVDLAGEWHARAMRAPRVLFKPVAVIALPRMLEQDNLGSMDAVTAPFDVGESFISLGDGLLVSRDRVDDLLVSRFDVGLGAAP